MHILLIIYCVSTVYCYLLNHIYHYLLTYILSVHSIWIIYRKQLLSNLSQQIESLNLRSPNTELSNQSPRNRSDQENQPSNTTSSQLKNNIRLFPDRRNSLNRIAAFNNEARRNSDISSSNGRRDSDLSLSSFSDRRDSFSRVGSSLSGYRRDSEASFYSTSERRDSFNSNISSCYEDEWVHNALLLKQISL